MSYCIYGCKVGEFVVWYPVTSSILMILCICFTLGSQLHLILNIFNKVTLSRLEIYYLILMGVSS